MRATAPIFLFTDFGTADVYVGQVKSVLYTAAPASAVVDLLNDVPAFSVEAAAHLLAALIPQLPAAAVCIAVVDPGVGSSRGAIAAQIDQRWYVGPDNGVLSVAAARARALRVFALDWMPAPKTASFHGRDLFARAAARIARGDVEWGALEPRTRFDVDLGADDLEQIIYIDHYGNAMTGIRASSVGPPEYLIAGERRLPHARVFSEAPKGELFWYENSIGLLEIAANQASAASIIGLRVGQHVRTERRS